MPMSPAPTKLAPAEETAGQDSLILVIVAAYTASFIAVGLAVDGPGDAIRGIAAIVTSRDTLLTDYFGIAGI